MWFSRCLKRPGVCLMAAWPVCHHETAAVCIYFRPISLMTQHRQWPTQGHLSWSVGATLDLFSPPTQQTVRNGFCFFINAQIDGVIDDIISLESSLNDEFMTLIDTGLQLPNTVCPCFLMVAETLFISKLIWDTSLKLLRLFFQGAVEVYIDQYWYRFIRGNYKTRECMDLVWKGKHTVHFLFK